MLKDGALSGLNPEARSILLAMINTGARPLEIAALLPEHIHLAAKVPYIEVLPEGRQVKSAYAVRKIPLVGVSLAALQACPGGFPRYRNRQAFSATINNFANTNSSRRRHTRSTAFGTVSRTACWHRASTSVSVAT